MGTISNVFRSLALALGVAAAVGCSAADASAPSDEGSEPPRPALGKADAIGSCAGDGANFCGGKSSGNCWCDAKCASHGDCCADSVACGGWSVNDVSYLFPLPKKGEDKLLLRFDSKGPRGELLPKKHFAAHVPFLWEGFYREEAYAWSRILAFRIDPCAGETEPTDTTKCRREVRLSAQPLWGDPSIPEPMTSAIDAAVHLIYELDQDDFSALLAGLVELRKDSPSGDAAKPLGPHPAMVREGLSGPFAKGLRTLITKYVGASNLVKFTIMTRGRNSTNWKFAQFERNGTSYEPAPIPATNDAPEQGVNEIGLSGQHNTRDTLVSPVDPEIGYPSDLLKSSEVGSLSQTKLEAALGRLASYEDPAKFSNKTLDCASCHLSENARPYFEKLTGKATPKKYLTFEAPPGQNLTRHDQTELSGNVLRAFGYFEEKVAISQRTINESARVADWLSRGGP